MNLLQCLAVCNVEKFQRVHEGRRLGCRSITLEEFMQADRDREDKDNVNEPKGDETPQHFVAVEENLGTAISAATLSVAALSIPKMAEPVTFKAEGTMKGAMETLINSRSERGYLVDERRQVTGVVTLRDIISQFAPPLAEAPNQWAGFFENALQQTGTSVESGHLVTAN